MTDSAANCAGVIFRCGDQYLLIKRVENGVWERPGGHIDAGETSKQAAAREALEEVGRLPDGDMCEVRQSSNEKVHYTTFLQDIDVFCPTLSDEHTDWGWFEYAEFPADTHPEVRKTIQLLQSRSDSAAAAVTTELDVARDIRDGKLDSPQRHDNKWLFKIRVTGTGISYRPSLKEYVYRPPEIYLNNEFLERCQGLPVIFDHPEKSLLNTDEFRNRSIGSIMLPFIQDDEVWCIALIYDQDAAELMCTSHISTSPAVGFEPGTTRTTRAPDGSRLLIEGEPTTLDHLACCEAGVWDKGGPPSGVETSRENLS